MFGSAADSRRRNDIVNSTKSFKNLTEKLNHLGFKISRSATYLRLLPRNSQIIEGKRHVSTVPVKLRRAQNDECNGHPGMFFCKVSIRALEILGPNQVFFQAMAWFWPINTN